MSIHSTAADRAALTSGPANDRLLIFMLDQRRRQEAVMSEIPNRSKRDADIRESLRILGAVGNAALIERNYALSEENRALLAQNESLLDGAAKRQGYVEELEATCAGYVEALHVQARNHVAQTARLHAEIVATRGRELARLTRPTTTRRAQAGDLALTGLAAAALAVEDAERRVRAVIPRVRAMRNPARRLGTTGRLALFTVICCCVGWALVFGPGAR